MDKTVIKSVLINVKHVTLCLVYPYLFAVKVGWVRIVSIVSLWNYGIICKHTILVSYIHHM